MTVLKIINLSVGLVLLILLLGAGVYLNRLLSPNKVQSETTVLLQTDPVCDLNRQACIARDHQGWVELRFKQSVKYLTRFDIEVIALGFKNQSIEKMLVDFSMVDMQMGINRFAMTKTPKNNVWQGMAILPVCISGRRDWQVKLQFGNSELDYTAIYKLSVEN